MAAAPDPSSSSRPVSPGPGPASDAPVDLSAQSVAGEEDPGAGADLARDASLPMAPGDQARPGTPGTGEGICPHCGGTGRHADGQPCPHCAGTGRVVQAIGGA